MKSRILYLVPDLFGPPSGIARYCRMVCGALSQASQASHNQGGDTAGRYALSVISLLDKSSARSEAKVSLPGARYLPCSGRRAVFVHRALRAVLKVRSLRPDIILVGHPNFAPLGRLLALLSRARMVSFIYGIDAWEPLSASRRNALSSSDLILSISRFTARRAQEENGVPLGRVRILHNCLDPQFQLPQLYAPSTCSGSPVRSLLTVSRISLSEGYKGHDQVIRALPAMLKEFPDLIYNVVGDGDGRSALEALALREGVSHVVRFHGVVSDAEVARFYREATVFIMPSRGEGFGFAAAEAMAAGLPCVLSDQVGLASEVGHSGAALVVPCEAEALATAIASLMDDGDLRRSMGARAACLARARFSIQATTRALVEQYAHLIVSKPSQVSGDDEEMR